MKRIIGIALIAAGLLSCDKDDDNSNTRNLTLNLTGLSDPGPGYVYEGWIIVNGSPVSTGTFTVNNTGQLSRTTFSVNEGQLGTATKFVLTVEPMPDNNPAPSNIKILAGDFSNNTASLSVSDMSALGNNFNSAAGSYILATPTNGSNTNENSGVWFLDPAAGPGASLMLPVLSSNWKYEGWAVINNIPVTTGKFTMTSGMDEAAPFSGALPGPPFPGEDFLMNAPAGLTFPTDLSGGKIVITIEPHPDNSPMPFPLKPLAGDVPANAMSMTSYQLMNTASQLPSGSVTR